MFGIHIITDVIKIPACDLQYLNSTSTATTTTTTTSTAIPGTVNNAKHTNHNDMIGGDTTTTTVRTKVVTKKSLLPIIHREIDILYPNRVLIDIGLVISRYYYHHHGRFNHTTGTGSSTIDTTIHTASTELKLHNENHMTSKKRKRPPKSSSSSSSSSLKVPKKQELLYMGTKLLQNGGTCDSYGTSSSSTSTTGSSNGGCGVHYKVQFPVIVFRPYVGEVLYGTICDMNPNGIIVTLGNFFAAIYIPTIYMLHPSAYVSAATSEHTNTGNKGTGIWVWSPTYDDDDDDDGDDNDDENNNSNDDDNEPLRYEMNIGDEIRVRVKSIHYSKPESTTISTKNGKPISSSNSNIEGGNHANNNNNNNSTMNHPTKRPRSTSVTTTAMNHTLEQQQSPLQHCAMYIIASICEDGLGLTSWWKNEMEEDDDDDNDDDNEE